MNFKTVVARLVLVWILVAQKVYVCLSARTTVPLDRLGHNYALAPTPSKKAELDNEFERVANYESHRAIGRFALLLTLDVALIALFWNFGVRRLHPTQPPATTAEPNAQPLNAS